MDARQTAHFTPAGEARLLDLEAQIAAEAPRTVADLCRKIVVADAGGDMSLTALQPLSYRLLVTTQDAHEARAALPFKVGVEIVPTGKVGDRHHVVAAGIASHPFDIALRYRARTYGASMAQA